LKSTPMSLLRNTLNRKKRERKRIRSREKRSTRRDSSRMRDKRLSSNSRRDYLPTLLAPKREPLSKKIPRSASPVRALLCSLEVNQRLRLNHQLLLRIKMLDPVAWLKESDLLT
jgi:hypothetical protein